MKILSKGGEAPAAAPEPKPDPDGMAPFEAPLQFLAAEMAALMGALPGGPKRTEAERLADEARTEAGFDNMPV